jgi:hypothetical protein
MMYGASGDGGDGAIDRDVVERWFRDGDGGRGAMRAAMERLGRLRVLRAGSREERMKDVEGDDDDDVEALMRGEDETTSLMDPSVTSYVLHPAFAANVRRALERGFAGLEDFDAGEETKGDAEAQSKAPDRATLNAYAKSKWEDLLLTLTGASDAFSKPGSKVRLDAQALFRAAGLTTATAAGIKIEKQAEFCQRVGPAGESMMNVIDIERDLLFPRSMDSSSDDEDDDDEEEEIDDDES